MKPRDATHWVRGDCRTALPRFACAMALVVAVLFSLGGSSFLYATHVKSELDEKNRPVRTDKMGKLGEVDRGPRGKNEDANRYLDSPVIHPE